MRGVLNSACVQVLSHGPHKTGPEGHRPRGRSFFFFFNLSVIKSPSFFLIYTKALFSFSVVGVIEILAKLKSVKILRDNFFFPITVRLLQKQKMF